MLVEKRESGFLFRSVDFSTYLHTLLITEYTYIYMYDCFVIGTYRCVRKYETRKYKIVYTREKLRRVCGFSAIKNTRRLVAKYALGQ